MMRTLKRNFGECEIDSLLQKKLKLFNISGIAIDFAKKYSYIVS